MTDNDTQALTITAAGGQLSAPDDAFTAWVRLEVANGAASADTIAGYVREARQFRAWLDGHALTVRDVTRDTVKLYRGELVARGLAAATIAFKLAVVRRLLDAGGVRDSAGDNPAARVTAPRDRRDAEDRINYLMLPELRRLLSVAASTRDRLLLELLAVHGLRTIEAHRLNCGDITRVGAADVLTVHGKGHDRTVYLRASTAAGLRVYLTERGHPDAAAALFLSACNRTTGGRLLRHGIRQVTNRALVAAGVKQRDGKRISTHTLRHTFATLSLLAGAETRHVQAQGGWRDPRMLDTYGHVVARAKHNPSELLAL